MTDKGVISGLLYDHDWIIMEYGNGQKKGSCVQHSMQNLWMEHII